MGTVNRIIQSDDDRLMAARLVEGRSYPFTLTITDGKPRTKAQNRVQHMWMKEISEQKGDVTPEEARAYCKLTIGVPILRNQNAAFKERYDEILKPLSYPQKLALMSEPLNLPVTSLMSTKQLSEYLEGIIRHFGEQGIILTMPDDLRDQINSNSGDVPSSPDTADDSRPASSAAAGEATDTPSSASPAATLSDVEWLASAARMLWAATNVGGDTDANLSVLNAQRLAVSDIKATPSQPIRDKAGSIYRQCKAVVMSEVEREVARKFIAGIAGVEDKDLKA
jgi:hypothetical protein